MIVLQNNQLSELKQMIDKMLDLLKTYDVFSSAKFQPTLQMISKNIGHCIRYNFDGIEELSRYIYEDWRSVCVGKLGVENWYLNIVDLELRGKVNKIFEDTALTVEKILGTNFIIPRKWYSNDELIRIGKKYKERQKDWDVVIEKLISTNRYYQSPIKQIPDDIWSFAKMLCIAGTDASLEEWFLKDIPAFGYLSPKQILQIENGDDILRNLMYDIPI